MSFHMWLSYHETAIDYNCNFLKRKLGAEVIPIGTTPAACQRPMAAAKL
jgi:hypothetical protein